MNAVVLLVLGLLVNCLLGVEGICVFLVFIVCVLLSVFSLIVFGFGYLLTRRFVVAFNGFGLLFGSGFACW